GRREPGLRPQHLKAVEAAILLSRGRAEGAVLGSREILFEPGRPQPGSWTLDVGTAGSVTLVLQAILLPALSSAGVFEFTLVGGTDTAWSPPVDYLVHVTLLSVRAFGDATLEVRRRGYYPKGGGRVVARLVGHPGPWPPLRYDAAPHVTAVRGLSHAAAMLRAREVAERQAHAAEKELAGAGLPVSVGVEYADTASPGSGIVLWTEGSSPPLGASALGERGKSAEAVGAEAARALVAEIEAGAAVDRHLADQLVPFLAVAGGRVRASRITGHTRSNAYVARTILGVEFRIDEEGGLIEALPSEARGQGNRGRPCVV
ncbi:MAG: RNA 3'-terminal phosphate cyclase, partial [Gemmatimonadetes bacterium]|nr:RNA 3'-terminal phosphate cyclase [Gemmatimonadota bacterium]